LKFKPEDGLSVIARGQLSIYEARGEYQLIVELLEPAGLGALQLAFEQLKTKLAAEGLFEAGRKKPLPVLPGTVAIITSPGGAVIRDILRVLRRRFRNINVLLYPARVQGEGAAAEIVAGLKLLNRHPGVDVILLARGGGSMEDLWAFNEEIVARAIAASLRPVISAVGHETDFTIADFVADLRAPTPSAAAELVVHRKEDFRAEIEDRNRHLVQCARLRLAEARHRLHSLDAHRVFQALGTRVARRSQRVDEAVAAMNAAMRGRLGSARQELGRVASGVVRYDFDRLIKLRGSAIEDRRSNLRAARRRRLASEQNRLNHSRAMLGERNPLAILNRGYSITRDSSGRIIRDAASVLPGSDISVRLGRGELGARVSVVKP
jgi:exodeoxyribonuclease VII large subunit